MEGIHKKGHKSPYNYIAIYIQLHTMKSTKLQLWIRILQWHQSNPTCKPYNSNKYLESTIFTTAILVYWGKLDFIIFFKIQYIFH